MDDRDPEEGTVLGGRTVLNIWIQLRPVFVLSVLVSPFPSFAAH